MKKVVSICPCNGNVLWPVTWTWAASLLALPMMHASPSTPCLIWIAFISGRGNKRSGTESVEQ